MGKMQTLNFENTEKRKKKFNWKYKHSQLLFCKYSELSMTQMHMSRTDRAHLVSVLMVEDDCGYVQ